jgi:tetratricopeptide (TPR) repeat protein
MNKIYFVGKLVVILVFIFTSSFTKSQTNTDSLLAKLEAATEDSAKVKILSSLSNSFAITDLKKSFDFANQAIKIAKSSGLQDELLAAYKVFGKICFEKGLMEEAVKYFELCLEMINKKGDKLQIAMANNNIASTWLAVKKYENAKIYYYRSLQLLKDYAQDKGDSLLHLYVLNIYNNLGVLYMQNKNNQDATTNFDLGIKMAENTVEYPNTRVALLQNKGDLLIVESKFAAASILIQQSIVLCEQLQFGFGLATSYVLKGRILEQQGDKMAALENYKKGYTYATVSESNELIYKTSDKLQSFYKEIGKTDSAFKYLTVSIASDRTMKKQEAREALEKNENKKIFATWQKEMEAKQKSSNFIFLLIIATIIFTLIVISIFYFQRQKVNKLLNLEKIENELSIQRLELDKKLLQASLEQKEKQLTNDILYQIKNNEMIEDVVKKLLTQTSRDASMNKEIIQESIRNLRNTKENNVWEEFELRFKNVHEEFYNNLQQRYPDLTAHERRLCAFLRLNMTSKEISAITAQNPKSIDVARARLRKKIGITNEDIGLVEFLSTI